ncbi:hypothetical protein ACIPI6_01980 [Pseudomonas protegens]|uniref:hypothetical protein n=1 Tax=Pseudomonas protegens TaxID=380021 RepID=UPI0038057C30
MGFYFDFKACECHNTTGELESIPAGRHIVTELGDVVTVEIATKTFELYKDDFKSLQKRNIVTQPLG